MSLHIAHAHRRFAAKQLFYMQINAHMLCGVHRTARAQTSLSTHGSQCGMEDNGTLGKMPGELFAVHFRRYNSMTRIRSTALSPFWFFVVIASNIQWVLSSMPLCHLARVQWQRIDWFARETLLLSLLALNFTNSHTIRMNSKTEQRTFHS